VPQGNLKAHSQYGRLPWTWRLVRIYWYIHGKELALHIALQYVVVLGLLKQKSLTMNIWLSLLFRKINGKRPYLGLKTTAHFPCKQTTLKALCPICYLVSLPCFEADIQIGLQRPTTLFLIFLVLLLTLKGYRIQEAIANFILINYNAVFFNNSQLFIFSSSQGFLYVVIVTSWKIFFGYYYYPFN